MAKRFDLDQMVRDAIDRWSRMLPEERAIMRREQRRGYVVSEAGWGSDADEAAYRVALHSGDTDELTRLQNEALQRMKDAGDRFDKEFPPHG